MNTLPILLPWGLGAVLLAVLSWWSDHRRARRRNPDAVGFMPWTSLFILSLFAACLLLGLTARAWISG